MPEANGLGRLQSLGKTKDSTAINSLIKCFLFAPILHIVFILS